MKHWSFGRVILAFSLNWLVIMSQIIAQTLACCAVRDSVAILLSVTPKPMIRLQIRYRVLVSLQISAPTRKVGSCKCPSTA